MISEDYVMEVANRLRETKNGRSIHEILKRAGGHAQSYSTFSKKFREYYQKSYFEDLVRDYVNQDSEVLNKLIDIVRE